MNAFPEAFIVEAAPAADLFADSTIESIDHSPDIDTQSGDLFARHFNTAKPYVVPQARFAFPSDQLDIVRGRVLAALQLKRGLRSVELDDSFEGGAISIHGKNDHMVLAVNAPHSELCHVTTEMQNANVKIIDLTFENHND